MTATPLPSSHASFYCRAPSQLLGKADVRRGLEALLRRRVPSQDVDDIAQTVLTEALASPVIPSHPDELRRWLTGIARHKIADFHRSRARSLARLGGGVEGDDLEAAVTALPVAFEEREVLHALLGEKRSKREAQTMDWLFREHAGERLADIASEQGVPAPVVRQRVSRLRRALRSRWTAFLGIAAIVGGISALGAVFLADEKQAIEPEPAAFVPLAPASATAGDLAKVAEGDWIVRDVRSDRVLTPVEQRLVEREANTAKISIHGKRITLETHGGFKTGWRVTSFEKTGQGAHLVLRNDSGLVSNADVAFVKDEQGPRLQVTLHDARFGGTITLRRPSR